MEVDLSREVPKNLVKFIRLQRPHGGTGEEAAALMVEQDILGMGLVPHRDASGNVFVQTADNGIWFCAHLDTVHAEDGIQMPVLLKDTHVLVADTPQGNPSILGADDAAGVYLLLEMLAHGVPGNYAFFMGEEVGGVGSSAFIRENQGLSASVCVSFDRRGTDDIITHQGGYRTASDEFAKALASALNKVEVEFQYKPSAGGVYTDSREFAETVAECTNISVGYMHEHTIREELDLDHLMRLRDAVLAIDWESLPVRRIPEPDSFGYGYGFGYDYNDDTAVKSARAHSYELGQMLNAHFDDIPHGLREYLVKLEEDLFNGC